MAKLLRVVLVALGLGWACGALGATQGFYVNGQWYSDQNTACSSLGVCNPSVPYARGQVIPNGGTFACGNQGQHATCQEYDLQSQTDACYPGDTQPDGGSPCWGDTWSTAYEGFLWSCEDPNYPVFNQSIPDCVANPCPQGQDLVNGSCVQRCPTSGDASEHWHPESSPGSFQAQQCLAGCMGTDEGKPTVQLNSNQWIKLYKLTGETCGAPGSGGAIDPANTSTANNQDCATNSNGVKVCVTAPNCGTVNGESVCLGSAPTPGNCTSTPKGNVYCTATDWTGGGLNSPPAPDNGTVGDKANPDASIGGPQGSSGGSSGGSGGGGGSNVVVNQYGPCTLASSTNDQPPLGSNVSCSGNGNGSSSGGSGGNGSSGGGDSLSGGTDCSSPPSCSGDAVQCYQATEEWNIVCAYQRPSDDSTTTDVDAGLTSAKNAGTPTSSVLQKSGDDIDVSSWYSAQSVSGCSVQDVTLNLGRAGSVSVPLSSYCSVFQDLGLLVLVSAGLLSLWIMAKGSA